MDHSLVDSGIQFCRQPSHLGHSFRWSRGSTGTILFWLTFYFNEMAYSTFTVSHFSDYNNKSSDLIWSCEVTFRSREVFDYTDADFSLVFHFALLLLIHFRRPWLFRKNEDYGHIVGTVEQMFCSLFYAWNCLSVYVTSFQWLLLAYWNSFTSQTVYRTDDGSSGSLWVWVYCLFF